MSLLAVIERLRRYYARPLDFVDQSTLDLSDMGYYNRITVALPDLQTVLEREFLGSGNFSKVYALNDRCVLKVNTGSYDIAYVEWADYCSRHAHANPWLPRVYYRGMAAQNTPFYVLERLRPSNFGQEQAWLYSLGELAKACEQGIIDITDPYLRQVCLDMGHMFTDCAGRNIMMRGDQFVLTDPCS